MNTFSCYAAILWTVFLFKQLFLSLCVPESLLLFIQRLPKAQDDLSNLLLALAKLFATSGEESSVEEDRKEC